MSPDWMDFPIEEQICESASDSIEHERQKVVELLSQPWFQHRFDSKIQNLIVDLNAL